MLSHPANHQPEEASVATATSQMRKASANRRRHLTVSDVLGHFDREFFLDWFVRGPRLVLTGRFSRRAAGFMIASALPAILATLFLTIPGLLFHTPEHHAFFHFAKTLESDGTSMLPVFLGTLSSLCSFRFPLG
jgi:hypothetical protein